MEGQMEAEESGGAQDHGTMLNVKLSPQWKLKRKDVEQLSDRFDTLVRTLFTRLSYAYIIV